MRCAAQNVSPHAPPGRCQRPAWPGSRYCDAHRDHGGAPAPFRRTPEGLVDLRSLWYQTSRVCDYVSATLEPSEISGLLTANKDSSYARRYCAWRSGREEWVRLTTLDRFLCYLRLPLWPLGDPDCASSLPPAEALRRGHSLRAYTEEMDDVAA